MIFFELGPRGEVLLKPLDAGEDVLAKLLLRIAPRDHSIVADGRGVARLSMPMYFFLPSRSSSNAPYLNAPHTLTQPSSSNIASNCRRYLSASPTFSKRRKAGLSASMEVSCGSNRPRR